MTSADGRGIIMSADDAERLDVILIQAAHTKRLHDDGLTNFDDDAAGSS